MSVRLENGAMGRAVPFATAFLVGVCVFAWLAGPMLEARFGAEALLLVYGGVAAGAAGMTYVSVRRFEPRSGGGSTAARDGNATSVEAADAGSDDRPAGSDDRPAGTTDGTGGDRAGDAVTVSLDELEALDVEREVRELKAERESGRDERE